MILKILVVWIKLALIGGVLKVIFHTIPNPDQLIHLGDGALAPYLEGLKSLLRMFMRALYPLSKCGLGNM